MVKRQCLMVAGPSNAGKTALLSALLRHLPDACVIKWTHHPLADDRPGSDTDRLSRLGNLSVLASPNGVLIRGPLDAATLYRGIGVWCPQAQWILIEGGKHQPYPKVFLDPGHLRDLTIPAIALLLSPVPPMVPVLWETVDVPIFPQAADTAASLVLRHLDKVAFMPF